MSSARFISRSAVVAVSVMMAVSPVGARGQVQVIVASPPPMPIASPLASNGPLVVLDHVVAVINGDVILESDIREEVRFAVLQPGRPDPARTTPQNALSRLIDRDLILQQMKLTEAQVQAPSSEQVNEQLAQLRKQIPDCVPNRCTTDEQWRAFLSAHGLTEGEVASRWRQRMILLSFIQSRFGAGVRITQTEIEQYYQEEFVPEFVKRNLKAPALEAVSSRIQEILLQRKVNALLQNWLQSLKDSGNVQILSADYSQAGNSDDAEPDSGDDE